MRLAGKFLIFGIAALIFSFHAAAQENAQDAHRKILQAVERREYLAAATGLENLKRADPSLFAANNLDYLLARVAERQGDLARAAANYQAVANRRSLLHEYALRHLAEIARASGNLLLERTHLQEILTIAPDSLLADAARRRLARSYFESGNYEAVIARLAAGATASPTGGPQPPNAAPSSGGAPSNDARTRDDLLLLAEAYGASGRTNEARELFARLLTTSPNLAQPDDFALAGARGLDRLEAGADFGRKAPALGDYEHLRRAQTYQFNRDFFDARLHFQALIERHPTSGIVPDAIYQTGRTHAQEANFVEALNWFERVLERFPEHAVARDALLQAASAYARLGKTREAVTRYQRFIDKYPDAENLDRAYLNIIDVQRDAGANTEALKQAAKTQEVFRGRLAEALALFAQMRVRLVQEDWTGALADAERLLAFSDLGGARVPGGTSKTEITFLKALILENQRRFPEAIDVYLSIPDGRAEYYGWRATERLRLLTNDDRAKAAAAQKLAELERALAAAPNPEAQRRAAQDAFRLAPYVEKREQLLDAMRRSYAQLPDYQVTPRFNLLALGRREIVAEKRAAAANDNRRQALADELLFLGLYDEATPELEAALKTPNQRPSPANPKSKIQNPKSEDLSFTLAVYYNRGEIAHRAVGFIEPLWRSVPSDYQIELMPREQVELLYPAPYADALLRYAPPRNVDPRYALAIMRQESRFRADVKSNAAARGLMQFISTTADRIARELGRENFRRDDLYHPPTAVLFGAQYLMNIFRDFPGQPAAVAAAYNGGEDNVRRWLTRAKSDAPDRYVPEIVFSQSKDYAYKVMANYRVYQIFYDENLKLR